MTNYRRVLWIVPLVFALFCPVAFGGSAYISGVPDWNQPTIPDGNLPVPGPVAGVNSPVGGVTTAWCVPTASANVMGFYRDSLAGLTIADGSVFPVTTALPAVDWRDDMVDTQTAAPNNRQDLGWYLNTNSQGDGTLINGGMGGTHYGNILPGLGNYFNAHNLAPLLVNFADGNGPGNPWDTSGVAQPVRVGNVPLSYQRIQGELDADRPVLLHLSYWNIQGRQRVAGPQWLGTYDWGTWGANPGQGQGGQTYEGDLGHTVTVVGYGRSSLALPTETSAEWFDQSRRAKTPENHRRSTKPASLPRSGDDHHASANWHAGWRTVGPRCG